MVRGSLPTVAEVPALLERWAPDNTLDPAHVTVGTTRKARWHCPSGPDHHYETPVQTMYGAVTAGRPGCPYCRGLRPSVTNRLDVLFPWLAEQWHPTRNGELTPHQVVAGSNTDRWWQCPVAPDHVWEASPQHRSRAEPGRGCPFCRGLRPSVTNRLDVLHPDVAAQWHPTKNGTITPADIVATTHADHWWKCSAGPDHEWSAPVTWRTRNGLGCGFCANRRLSVTNNVAARAGRWLHLFDTDRNPEPAERTLANTEVEVHWRCPAADDHRWSEATGRVMANSWAKGNSGCPACSGQQVSTSNSLANHPALASEFVPELNGGQNAHEVVTGTSRKLTWRCSTCTHVWQASGANRLKHRGCPNCQRFNRSVLEVALIFELQTVFSDLELDRDKVKLDGRPRHVDVLIPSAQLVIEVDGRYHHEDRDQHDLVKSDRLRDAGWHVIRVREEPLEATHADDVVVPGDSPVKVVAGAVLQRASERGWVGRDAAETYLDELEPRRLGEALAEAGRRRPGKRLRVPGTPPGPTRRDRWEGNYDLLLTFFQREGHVRVPDDHVEAGQQLGAWVGVQRSRYRRGLLLSDRARRLAALTGWTWDVSRTAWEGGYARLLAYVSVHRTARVPVAYREADGYPLGTWVRTHRQPGHRKSLTADQRQRLEELPGWTFDNLVDLSFEQSLAALRSFAEVHGHVRLPRDGRWHGADLRGFSGRHRAAHSRGELPADRVAALEAVPGWSWRPQEQAWEDGFTALTAFVNRERHALVPSHHLEGDYPLGAWVREQRERGNRTDGDALLTNRRQRLEELPSWSWAPHADSWDRHYEALLTFVRERGHAAVPTDYEQEGLTLGSWVIRHRYEHKHGLVPSERVARLEAVPGWLWDTRDASWQRHLRALRSFVTREGHALVPADHVEHVNADAVQLGSWIVATRSRRKSGGLAPARIADLDAVDGWAWDARDAKWQAGFGALQAYVARTGSASRLPAGHLESGYRLGQWVGVQRSALRRGRLSKERAARLASVPGWGSGGAPTLFEV